jgi:hypothetical protein
MTFLDTGILVGAVLEAHPEHAACLAALEESKRPFPNAHVLAIPRHAHRFYKVPADAAAELISSVTKRGCGGGAGVGGLRNGDSASPQSRVMGGGIYDSLHATLPAAGSVGS